MAFVWEILEKYEKLVIMKRAKVPGGWFVMVKQRFSIPTRSIFGTARHCRSPKRAKRFDGRRGKMMNLQMEMTLGEMARRLVDEFAPDEVILFGSYAWGEPDENSDVDLLVIVERSDETPMTRDLRARRCLRGLNTPKDVLVRTRDEMTQAKRVTASLETLAFERGTRLYAQNLAAVHG